MTLRTQLLVSVLLLLALPLVGYQYVRSVERFMRLGMENNLAFAARDLAAALTTTNARFSLVPIEATPNSHRRRVESLQAIPTIDGLINDWPATSGTYFDLIPPPALPQGVTMRARLGQADGRAFAWLDVGLPADWPRRPIIVLVHQLADGRQTYFLSPKRDGLLPMRLKLDDGTEMIESSALAASISKTSAFGGQPQSWSTQFELEFPNANVNGPWALYIASPELQHDNKAAEMASSGSVSFEKQPGDAPEFGTEPQLNAVSDLPFNVSRMHRLGAPFTVSIASAELWRFLRARSAGGHRSLTVIGKEYQTYAASGHLAKTLDSQPVSLLDRLLPGPRPEALQSDLSSAGVRSKAVRSALAGTASVSWRALEDGQMVLSAAHPILADGQTVAAALVEESATEILQARRQALYELISTTFVVFSVGGLLLLGVTLKVGSRIRQLRDEALAATDPYGRVRHAINPRAEETDEIGDLRRGFVAVLGRLQQYNHYLEQLSKRLSHELRTPLAVIRSSLDNLAECNTMQEAQRYADRARDGIRRLETILSRMSEAARLEESIQDAERERVDLNSFLSAAVEAYADTWPELHFALRLPENAYPVWAAPELLMQLLDKLVANAVDFHTHGTPILIVARREESGLRICVENSGPLLPDLAPEKLFESMVSMRDSSARHTDVHLGLGLYIARLIAEFHGGTLRADNLPDRSGVSISLYLPLYLPAVGSMDQRFDA